MDKLTTNFENINLLSNDATEQHKTDAFRSSYPYSSSPYGDSGSNADKEDISFTGTLLGVMNSQDMVEILSMQNDISESLGALALKCQSFQEFSQLKYQALAKRFETHTSTIKELQHDLEAIFRRIRALKSKIMIQYPSQYKQVKERLPDIVVEDD